LRDRTLVEAQAQLDDIAAALATAFSTVPTAGTAVTDGASEGFDVDLDGLAPGNDVLITYTEDGVEKQVRLVNTTAEMDYIEGNGTRVVGVDFASGGPAAAAALGISIPGLQFAGPDATTLRVLNSAPAHAVEAAVARKTAGADQDAGLGLNLFVDLGDRAFTNAVDDVPPQRQGFAGRIAINSDILADNSLLVQHTTGGTLGDSARPDFLINQLNSMRFESGGDPAGNSGQFRLSGTVSDFVSQTINYQGSSIGRTIARRDDQMLTLETITQQMEADYGVNIDEEMSRLIALQNAYAANARVVSIVQDLLETLMAI
jgi:flagellar hook-associated protein 1 FlgK